MPSQESEVPHKQNAQEDEDWVIDDFEYSALPDDEDDDGVIIESKQEVPPPLVLLDIGDPMPQEHIDKIKEIMSKINISHTPEWAKVIPEEAWMPRVVSPPKDKDA